MKAEKSVILHAPKSVVIQAQKSSDMQVQKSYITQANKSSVIARVVVSTLEAKHVQPDVLLTPLQMVLINCLWLGMSQLSLVLSVEMIPAQVDLLTPDNSRGRWLGMLVAAGGALNFFISPIVGHLCDSLCTPFGRRKPIIALATSMMLFGLLGMVLTAPLSDTRTPALRWTFWRFVPPAALHVIVATTPHSTTELMLYFASYVLAITGFTFMTVAYLALIADVTPPTQRGLNSAIGGVMVTLGNICGALLGVWFSKSQMTTIYFVTSSVLLLTCVVSMCMVDEACYTNCGNSWPSPRSILRAFTLPFKSHPDFKWVFGTRLLMQMGLNTVMGYLGYWVADMVSLPPCWNPQEAVAVIILPVLLATAASTIPAGYMSDRTGRRKLLVIVSGLCQCIVCLLFSALPEENAFLLSLLLAVLYGFGTGLFAAVDFALAMDLLSGEALGCTMAVWHQAAILAEALAYPTAGFILDSLQAVNCEVGLGYSAMFLLTSCYFFSSTLVVENIASVS